MICPLWVRFVPSQPILSGYHDQGKIEFRGQLLNPLLLKAPVLLVLESCSDSLERVQEDHASDSSI